MVEVLPLALEDNSLGLYIVAFVIRSFSNMPAALREARRVLKLGGLFVSLKSSKVYKYPLFNAVYKQRPFGAIPLIGQLVAGDRDSYRYLVESIERFPSQGHDC
ncbi:2-hexaprenyl-6-methoxy-1,4-benzoquinone methyltransferase [Fusarium falciforme]|nr:2-hexaprenyl-6-methoxy-1,4-benzoquinone methyltransferase [Fusarium falciforme]